MAQADNEIPELGVYERLVDTEEFHQIGITQRFQALGWERALDWMEGATPRVYLTAVTNWLASLKFENKHDHPSRWRLVGDTGRGNMVMSFDTMNRIADFDSLGTDRFTYYAYDSFLSPNTIATDPENMVDIVLANRRSAMKM